MQLINAVCCITMLVLYYSQISQYALYLENKVVYMVHYIEGFLMFASLCSLNILISVPCLNSVPILFCTR